MTIEVNGTARELAPGTTVQSLIEACIGSTRGSAVVVDGAVVPRGDWPSYQLRAGQRVELIRAVQGG